MTQSFRLVQWCLTQTSWSSALTTALTTTLTMARLIFLWSSALSMAWLTILCGQVSVWSWWSVLDSISSTDVMVKTKLLLQWLFILIHTYMYIQRVSHMMGYLVRRWSPSTHLWRPLWHCWWRQDSLSVLSASSSTWSSGKGSESWVQGWKPYDSQI